MALFGIKKQMQPRQFDYRPRFYDPDKEAREERYAQSSSEYTAERMRTRIKARRERQMNEKRYSVSFIRLFLILGLIIIGGYVALNVLLPGFVQMLFPGN